MGSYKVKKPIYISAEEKARNLAIIDAAKAKYVKKNYKASCIFKKDGSNLEYISTGRFVDGEDASKFFNSLLDDLNNASKKWKMLGILHLNNDEIDGEDDGSQQS